MKLREVGDFIESGVDWAGLVPNDWRQCRIGDGAIVVGGYPFPSDRFDKNEGYPLVRIRDIYSTETEMRFNGSFVPEAAIDSGDILVGMDGDYNVAIWEGGEALLNQRVACVRALDGKLDQRFLFYLLPYPLRVINDLTYFTTVKHLTLEDIRKSVAFLPEFGEQTTIANFLDRETAKIDNLIEKQEQLIKLLEEKRQAVISHAVTKGLNPDVRMKDSGVEWLGEVPEHWDTSFVKHWLGSSPCYGVLKPDRYEGDDGVPVIRTLDVQNRSVLVNQLEQISPELSLEYRRTIIRTGDLILSVVGTIGRTFICNSEHEGMNLSRALARLQVRDSATARYLQYLIDSRCFAEYVSVTCTGTAQLVLNMADLSDWAVPSPSQNEMAEIVDHLDCETRRIDDTIDTVRRAISLSAERRTALIAAAVTGKIDVREAV